MSTRSSRAPSPPTSPSSSPRSFANSPDMDAPYLAAFRDRLRNLGYVEGTNVVVEARHAPIRRKRFPELAAELVRSKVDVLVVHGWPAAIQAAEQAINTIPVVFVANPDPIGSGIVASLARPGGALRDCQTFTATSSPSGSNFLRTPSLRSLASLSCTTRPL
jgi:putative ABC transport system substrate-binding protein